MTTLLGPNGAGKSTLVLTVAGILRPTAGTIFLGDRELTRSRPEQIRKAGVAVVPEGRRLLPELTVEDNLRVATYAMSRQEARRGIERAVALFPHLEARWKAVARTLSGGEQQMVVLAQAIVSRPRVLLVDELSLGLAPVVVKRLMPALEEVAAEGAGVLLIEQFVHVALSLAERVRGRGRADRLPRHGRRAEGQPGTAPLGVPAPRARGGGRGAAGGGGVSRTDAIERLCEAIVPGSGRVGPSLYVEATLRAMPPAMREYAEGAIDTLAAAADLAEHERTPEFALVRALVIEAFYSDFVAPGREGPGAWAEIDFNTPLATRLAKDWSYLGIA